MSRLRLLAVPLALGGLALAPLAACGSSSKAARYDEVLVGNERRMSIEILGSVAKACDLDPSRTYFAYNDDGLDEDARRNLRDVAQCLNSGKLKGHSILVTGYTDDTGSREYNLELGMERGEAVAFELSQLGIDPERIFVRSRGERDVRSEGPNVHERKVELSLVERDT